MTVQGVASPHLQQVAQHSLNKVARTDVAVFWCIVHQAVIDRRRALWFDSTANAMVIDWTAEIPLLMLATVWVSFDADSTPSNAFMSNVLD